jgi:signal transduction histidine kinase
VRRIGMRIQARLFVVTALLVLSLMAVQWWLQAHQLRAIKVELGNVATEVGKGILSDGANLISALEGMDAMVSQQEPVEGSATGKDSGTPNTYVFVNSPLKRLDVAGRDGGTVVGQAQVQMVGAPAAVAVGCIPRSDEEGNEAAPELRVLRFDLSVVDGADARERVLVLKDEEGQQSRIPFPVSPTVKLLKSTQHKGMIFQGGLLLVGLCASALMARQVARPLQSLAARAEALGRGDLGVEVPETSFGEVGELQRSFNSMSRRLKELEEQREAWRRREHLAQLGDLSRGLAHTVRNPLNTLGLVVEELASTNQGQGALVATAQSQIRHIDRWLRSFLALGAGDAAETECAQLEDLVESAVLEAVQQGQRVRLEVEHPRLRVNVVATALHVALANLIENAVDAAPEGSEVVVRVSKAGEEALVSVLDRGSGLPQEVRDRLFSPHVTTKVGGSGMGLFLARQLVVGMHGGRLSIDDQPEGGTKVVISLPRAPAESDEG